MSGADSIGAGDGRDDDVALAAEHVLGLLTPAEAAAFEARLAAEPDLRALVSLWTEDLATLALAIPEVAPPARVEEAIMRRLFPEEPRQGLLRRLGLLPALLGGLTAAVLVLVTVNLGLFDGPPAPTFGAEVATEDRSLVVVAAYDPEAASLRVERIAGTVPEGRAQQLWLIAGDAAPVPLGLLPDDGVAAIPVPAELVPSLAGGILAISDEAPGGSTTGSPGTVLATGPITET